MTRFLTLAELADQLAAVGSKLKKRALIAEALAAARDDGGVDDAALFARYLSGTPFAESDPMKLNAGGALLTRIVRELAQPSDGAFTAAYRKYGDLGAAAGDLFADHFSKTGSTPEPTLTLREMAESFPQIATARTTAQRSHLVTGLLARCTPVEAKYLLKLITGDMRIGVKQSLVEEAIAVAASAPLAALRNAVMLEADLARATRMAFEGTLSEARMRLFHPLGFMLASPVDTVEEAEARFLNKVTPAAAAQAKGAVESAEAETALPAPEDVADVDAEITAPILDAQIEDKYDGMRVQLHCADPTQPGRVSLYSRNREDVTASYPEVVEAFANVTDDSGGIILDGELLAWDPTADRALPFSVLSPRIGRKRVTDDIRTGTPVVFMAFDLLFADSGLLLDLPLHQRRQRLEVLAAKIQPVTLSPLQAPVAPPPGGLFTHDAPEPNGVQRFRISPVVEAHSAADLDRAYIAARDRGNEGVMIKSSDSLYAPGRRGLSWMKLKRHLDTLDVVITGAEFGNGRKAGLLSDYTFAVHDSEGNLQNVGKAYSGLTDVEILELTAWLKDHTLEDFGHFRTVEPIMILEVAFNNIMVSDRHSSGFALRFPRILQIRRDKPAAEIDTVDRVREIYNSQPDRPAELPN